MRSAIRTLTPGFPSPPSPTPPVERAHKPRISDKMTGNAPTLSTEGDEIPLSSFFRWDIDNQIDNTEAVSSPQNPTRAPNTVTPSQSKAIAAPPLNINRVDHLIHDCCSTHTNESVGLAQLKERCSMAFTSMQLYANGDHKNADAVLEKSRSIRVPRGLEATTLSRSCAFLDIAIVRDVNLHSEATSNEKFTADHASENANSPCENDVVVYCVDAYGNLDKFFPGTRPELLFGATFPGPLSSMLDPHCDPRDLARLHKTRAKASTAKVESLLTVTHGTRHGCKVKVEMSVVARWVHHGKECTLIKECFSDVTDAVRLTEQSEQQDRMRHDVRNKIDLARCYLEDHLDDADQEDSNVFAAQRILESISSTIRFTENTGTAAQPAQPFNVLSCIESSSVLLLEGFSHGISTTPTQQKWPMVTLTITSVAFECGVLNEIFINTRKHGDVDKPIYMHAELNMENSTLVLRVENSICDVKRTQSAFLSTNKGSNYLKKILADAGGSLTTETVGRTFAVTVTIPVKRSTGILAPLPNDSHSHHESTTIPRQRSFQQRHATLASGYRFIMIEDNKLIAKMWLRALEKRGLPTASFFHTGTDPAQLLNITSEKSELASVLEEAIAQKCSVGLIIDNYLGSNDDDEEITGVSILHSLRSKSWFQKFEDMGRIVTYFHTGTSVEDMHKSLSKQGVGMVSVFEKGGTMGLGEKISSMVQEMNTHTRHQKIDNHG